MNAYPVEWIRAERFSKLTGYTVEAIRTNRKRGVWPDGEITQIRRRRLFVNVRAYDQWVENGILSAVV